jgi:hypothetical protein
MTLDELRIAFGIRENQVREGDRCEFPRHSLTPNDAPFRPAIMRLNPYAGWPRDRRGRGLGNPLGKRSGDGGWQAPNDNFGPMPAGRNDPERTYREQPTINLVGRDRASATGSLQTKLTWFARALTSDDLTPSQQEERSMAWRTRTDAEIAALIGTRDDIKRTGVGIVVGVLDHDGRREAVA